MHEKVNEIDAVQLLDVFMNVAKRDEYIFKLLK